MWPGKFDKTVCQLSQDGPSCLHNYIVTSASPQPCTLRRNIEPCQRPWPAVRQFGSKHTPARHGMQILAAMRFQRAIVISVLHWF